MRLMLIFAAVAALSFSAADAATLTVKVSGLSDKGGMLRVAAYDAKGFAPGSTPLAAKIVPAAAGEVTVTLDGVAEGEICVKVLQDLNANGKMDFSMGFIPAEPYGFSNNPVINMGPPSWDDVKFTAKPGVNPITIMMK